VDEADTLALMRADTAIGAGPIKQARMRAGLSQAQLAERSGKAKVQVGRWETAVVAPILDTLLELLRACGFYLPLNLRSYEPVDDRPLVAQQRKSPGARLEQMLARAEQERERP
jgi:transcriptional regulator with XRE-family HTH domain